MAPMNVRPSVLNILHAKITANIIIKGQVVYFVPIAIPTKSPDRIQQPERFWVSFTPITIEYIARNWKQATGNSTADLQESTPTSGDE